MDETRSIGKRIKELRTAKGWSLDRLASASRYEDGTSLSRGTIWEAENKEGRVPWQQTLQAIADALDVSVEYLRTGATPASESNLSDFSPDVFGRAQGLTDPAHLAEWSTYLEILKRIEREASQGSPEVRGLESYSIEEFAHAHGLTDEKRVTRVREELETQIRLEKLDAIEANAAIELQTATLASTGAVADG